MTIRLSDYKCRKPLFSGDVLSGQQISVVDNGDETVTVNTNPLLATKGEFDSHAADVNAHHAELHNIDSHTDVTAPTPVEKESLIWDDGTSQWINAEARHQLAESNPTGLIDGGELNIGPGVNDIEVIGGEGVIIDSYTNPDQRPVNTFVVWTQINEPITAAPAVAGSIVWFTIDINGLLKQYAALPTEPTRRDEIFLGLVIYNGAEWGEVSSPIVVNNSAHTLSQYLKQIAGPTFIIDGGEVTEAATFTLDQSAGSVFETNRNWHVDKKDPHLEALTATLGLQFRYVNRDFTDVSALTGTVDPTQYDNAGTVSPITGSGNNASIQIIYQDPRDNVWILWGQQIFDNATEAAASISAMTEVPFLLQNSVLLAYIVLENGKSDWDIDEAFIVYPQGAGGVGGGGVPITQHSSLSGILPDQHHLKLHRNSHSTGGDDALYYEQPSEPVGAVDGSFWYQP